MFTLWVFPEKVSFPVNQPTFWADPWELVVGEELLFENQL